MMKTLTSECPCRKEYGTSPYFENCGRILRTFYRTEDRVKKLLAWETCSIWEAASHQMETRLAAGL